MVKKLKKGSFTLWLVVMVLCFIVTPLGAVSETEEKQGETDEKVSETTVNNDEGTFEQISENNNSILYYNQKSDNLYIKQKSNDIVWRSTPQNYDDSDIKKSAKNKYESQLYVTYYTGKNLNQKTMYSRICVNKKGIKTKLIDGGVQVTYTFKSQGFVIPVVYQLTNDGFEASVKIDQIKQSKEKYKLADISLLPLFGAGGKNDKGYMVVPDGSGAVINFNNGKSECDEYKQYIYGRDSSIDINAKITRTLEARLPIYGIKKGDAAVLSVIKYGASRTLLHSFVTGSKHDFNSVYPEFIYSNSATASFNNKSWDQKSVKLCEELQPSEKDFTIAYYFLEKEQANYTGMALRYQQYLKDEQQVETTVSEGEYPLYANFFGTIKRQDHILGFPVNREIPLTTYKDAEKILKQMKDSGVDDIVLKYNAWLAGGPDSCIPLDVKLSSTLGGKKAFTQLTDYLEKANIPNFFDINITDMYKSRFGYSTKYDCAKSMDKSPAMQYRYNLDLYTKSEELAPLYLLNPLKVTKAADKISNNIAKYNISGASLDSLGSKLYSSFNEENMDRSNAERLWVDTIQKIKDARGKAMFTDPNAYVIPFSSYISAIPVESTGYMIEDVSIPFYQIVLHGMKSYSMPAVNQTSEFRKNILKALETGSSLQFTCVAQNINKLQETPYNYLYSADYSSWINKAIEGYTEIQDVLKSVANSRIVGHKWIQKNVAQTNYENGIVVIVNYSDVPVEVNGITIDAENYYTGR